MKTIVVTPKTIGFVQLLSLFSYVTSSFFPAHVHIVLQLISGFFGLIFLPGLLLTQCVLSKNLEILSFGIITGLLINIFGIQLLFILSTFSKLVIALPVWLWSFDTVIVLAILAIFRQNVTVINYEILQLLGRRVLLVIFIGIILRVGLAVLAVGSIAPDGALYADYARHLVNGQFISSVQNDGAVIPLAGGTQFVAHQGFVFLFAVGWLLFPPATSGPVIVLIIIGSILPVLSFFVTQRYFDTIAARWVAGVVSVHPLFVFHSAVAYGPEISSLAVIVTAIALILDSEHLNNRVMLFVGATFGVVDSMWYSNFYVLFATLILSLFVLWKGELQKAATFSLLLGVVFIARLFLNLLVFICGATAVFLILFLARRFNLQLSRFHNYWLLGGMLGSIFIWRWPFFLSTATVLYSGSSVISGVLSSLFLRFNILVLGRFLFFVVFHVSIVLTILTCYALWSKNYRKKSAPFYVASLVAAIGTFWVLSSFGKEVLLPIYLYSDSRFFLFVVLSSVIGTSVYFVGRNNSCYWSTMMKGKKIQGGGLLVLILVGFVPGYLTIPTGLDLVDIESRYGWTGITEQIRTLGPNALVLADRAREFAWFTGLPTVTLRFSAEGLPVINASTEIKMLMDDFGAKYILFDGYTFAKWKTMEHAYLDKLSINEPIILFEQKLVNRETDSTINATTLQLIIQTESNQYNRQSRIFRIGTAIFQKTETISFIEDGWFAGNGGSISNESGICRLKIGENANYTFTTRKVPFDLGLSLRSGFGILQLQEVSAIVTRIEIWDINGNFLRYAEQIRNNQYFFPFGTVEIGDIRVVIKGFSNGYVNIVGFSIWEYR